MKNEMFKTVLISTCVFGAVLGSLSEVQAEPEKSRRRTCREIYDECLATADDIRKECEKAAAENLRERIDDCCTRSDGTIGTPLTPFDFGCTDYHRRHYLACLQRVKNSYEEELEDCQENQKADKAQCLVDYRKCMRRRSAEGKNGAETSALEQVIGIEPTAASDL